MKEKQFSTLDVYLSAFLELHGFQATLERSNGSGRIVFVFPQSDELYRYVNAFNGDEMVPVAGYASAVRTLKARMFAIRQGGGQ
jgi:hypothetical protein